MSVFYVNLHENIMIVLQTVSMYITPITTYSASYLILLQQCTQKLGGGPRIVVSTAAFHA